MLKTSLCLFVFMFGLVFKASPAIAGVEEESYVVESGKLFQPGEAAKTVSIEEAEEEFPEMETSDALASMTYPVHGQVMEAAPPQPVMNDRRVEPPVQNYSGQAVIAPRSGQYLYQNGNMAQPAPYSNYQGNSVTVHNGPQGYSGAQLAAGSMSQGTASTVEYEATAPSSSANGLRLTPVFGTTRYVGAWNNHIENAYTFGLILEKPVSELFSVELEGSYSKNWITYSNYVHSFNQWGIAGNGKMYLLEGPLRPFVGAGIVGTYFQNMSRGPLFPARYNHMLGSGQLIAGADVGVTEKVSLGVRGAFIRPLFNQPGTVHNGVISAPGFEESSAINSSFVRLMGAVKIAF